MTAPHQTLALFAHWERVIGCLLDRTLQFPKHSRFTFASRMDGLALDILEQVVTACYGTAGIRHKALVNADLSLARLRVLLRLSHARQFLSGGAYEALARDLDETGRMLGGWRASLT
jgi:hypothetical protein